jgi:energy-converting hydrogenase Eha subunit A
VDLALGATNVVLFVETFYGTIIALMVGALATTTLNNVLTDRPPRFGPVKDILFQTTIMWAAILAVFFSLFVYSEVSAFYSDIVLGLISNPILTPVWLCLGFALYWLRGRMPFVYGILETVVGTLAIFYAIQSPAALPAKLIALLGGLYIVVRGLDNMDKGLPNPLRSTWDRWFPKRTPTKSS